jgi:dihydroflavonol-4-reductase
VVVGIPSMTFGEYDPGNSTGSFVIEMANRTLPSYVAGKRNVVYAGDAGRGLVRVCEDGHPGERYLICGENLTMQQLMAKMLRLQGLPNPRRFLWPQPSCFRHGRFLSTSICTARFRKYRPVPLR